MLLGRLHGHDTQKYIQTCPENCLVDLGKVEMGGGGTVGENIAPISYRGTTP